MLALMGLPFRCKTGHVWWTEMDRWGESSEAETISTCEAVLQLASCLAPVRNFFYLLWHRRCCKEGSVKVELQLVHRELFESDQAAREEGPRGWEPEEQMPGLQWHGRGGEKCLRDGTLSCCLVRWRKGTQGCAMKQKSVVEGTARRCSPHWGLEAGLEQIKMPFLKMRGRKQGWSCTSSVRCWRKKTYSVTKYDPAQMGVEFIFLIIVLFLL